jgi:uncharacterized protein DUF1579
MAELRGFLCVSAVVLIAVFASAQMTPPKPGPELKRLDYFAGTWTLQGDMKPSEFGPGGKMTESERSEWMQGGFFLVSHVDFKSAMGDGTGLAIMGYNPDEEVYTYDAFNSWGEGEHAKGSVSGDTWSWLSEDKMMGKPTKTRFTMKEGSPDAYTFKFEMAGPDGVWKTVMDGTATKKK